ncbi:aldehyde dehydrogenase family protein [Bacillus velezensis]|uniref:aldehyde dehydrogenase family protein n=1 Tax=Bacillus velezensis TaxID=492670 RepID=UPI000F8EDEAE|nr:aldehyde dehydrogenase family protein [Bacillus velezensis]RUR98109.1 Aldehyde dehydrogenase [Bacillus velezensis]
MAFVKDELQKKLYINGEWRTGSHYQTLKAPFDQSILAEIPQATTEETKEAIDAAHRAIPVMKKLSRYRRSNILADLVRLLQERRDEAARLIALEAAKPLKVAEAEVERTIQTYQFAAEEAKRLQGEIIPIDAAPGGEGRMAFTNREPLGVVGAITPFNFPMNLVAHKVGPAIAAGNPVVLKPASQTPLSGLFLAELLSETDLPKGALNVVTGSGKIVGDHLVTDERVKMITFTGSPEVGMQIRSKAGLKKVTLELGSNSAVIIDKETEIERIVERCVSGAFSYQGQVCISLQRMFIHESLYQPFMKLFMERTKKLVMGDPLDPDTDLSAMISSEDVKRSKEWVDEARQMGATVHGGHVKDQMLAPTVIEQAQQEMKVNCQEAFAPIVTASSFTDLKEAIERVNDSRYGLQAGIYTNRINDALDAADQLEVGGVIINDIPTFRVDQMPYGGVKESGTGREGIKYAIEEMTESKLVVINRQ